MYWLRISRLPVRSRRCCLGAVVFCGQSAANRNIATSSTRRVHVHVKREQH